MFKTGTPIACKAALAGFAIFFLVCSLGGMGVGAACLRAVCVAFAVFLSVKFVYFLFMDALVDELSEFMRKERLAKKTEAES